MKRDLLLFRRGLRLEWSKLRGLKRRKQAAFEGLFQQRDTQGCRAAVELTRTCTHEMRERAARRLANRN